MLLKPEAKQARRRRSVFALCPDPIAWIGVLALCALGVVGCDLRDYSEAGLVQRVTAGLEEAGGDTPIVRCLSEDLDSALTEKDAQRTHGDVASNPEISEHSLNYTSLALPAVKNALSRRAIACRSRLVAEQRYTPKSYDRALLDLGLKAYPREPGILRP